MMNTSYVDISVHLEKLLDNMKMRIEKYDLLKWSVYLSRYCRKHPVISVVGGLLAAVYAVPVSLFVAFGIVSFLITFAGFLIIEGAVMIVAFIILISVLSTLTTFIILASLTCWLLYLMTSQIYLATNVNITPNKSLGTKLLNNDYVPSFEQHEE